MERTTYFNLNKPGLNDYVAVSDLNLNMDILDSNVHRVDLTNGGTIRGGQLNIQDGSSLNVYCSNVQNAIVAHDTSNMNGILTGSKNDSTGAGCYTNVSNANEGLYFYSQNSEYTGWIIRHNETTHNTVLTAPTGKNIQFANPPIFSDIPLITDGLTLTNCTVTGGFCKMGLLCLVALRITTTALITSGSTLVSGLPLPTAYATSAQAAVAVSTSLSQPLYIRGNGNLQILSGDSIDSGTAFVVTTVYASR